MAAAGGLRCLPCYHCVFMVFSDQSVTAQRHQPAALNIADVTADIHDASDENLLVITRQIARQLNGADQITPELLKQLARQFSVAEINYVDRKGVIRASTYPDFIDYGMASGEQSAAFLVLLDGQREYVQPYGPVSFDESIFRKYAAVTLDNRGFVQVGYDAQQFQSDISHHVKGATHNRHVGENGSIIIADEKRWIVSDRKGNEDTDLGITGLQIDTQTMPANQGFSTVVYGEPCYCMYQVAEGFLIIAVIPKSEAALSRNVSVGVTTVMQILVFAALFVLIYVLVKRLVVDNIHRVNRALSRITDGSFTYLKSKAGFVLAGMEGMRYARQELQLAPGDVLYLYTDAVTGATDCGETLYGEPRLQEVLNAHAKSDAQGIYRAVKEDVDRFAGEAPQFDDITMLCLRYHGNGDTAERKGI